MAKNYKKEAEDYKELLQRLQAEFENYRKRKEKESEELKKYSTKELIEKLLIVLDNFDLAFNNTKSNEDFMKGIELVYGELFSILSKEGLKKIKAKGEKFNPEIHEALFRENEGDIVMEELQPGYELNNKIIRPAKVKVGGKE